MSENKNDQFQKLSAPKGVPDYAPPQSAAFIHVRDEFARQARIAGYQHIELPVFEDTTLFARGVGESTDVVSKEMYLSLIHISEPTRREWLSRMPSSA